MKPRVLIAIWIAMLGGNVWGAMACLRSDYTLLAGILTWTFAFLVAYPAAEKDQP